MGYTHYFTKVKQPTPQQWDAVQKDFRTLYQREEADQVIQYDSDNPAAAEVSDVFIWFNGIGNDGHETFGIGPLSEPGFDFCKTARKPYDLWVTATLILIDHHCPGCWEISSDGKAKDWEEGLKLARTVQSKAAIPIGILS